MTDPALRMSSLFRIPAASLQRGPNFVQGRAFIVYLDAEGGLRACLNRCRHQGGRFGACEGDRLTCTHHGWVLNARTMTYDNPVGGQAQAEVDVRREGDWVVGEERVGALPWDPHVQPLPLQVGELTVQMLAHASCLIRAGDSHVVTDPWLLGPAFVRGWWLAHAPPAHALEAAARAECIYISHNHSDHLNWPTLRALAEINPDIPIVVPRFDHASCSTQVRQCGLRNVHAQPFGEPYRLKSGATLTILRDGTTRDDSGMLFEYKGHRILDTVDCSDLNGGVLPSDIDLLMTSFAGGATGYPICWGELYPDEVIERRLEANRAFLRQAVVKAILHTRARTYIPFAGYFTESHPADAAIKAKNRKNTPEDLAQAVAKAGLPTHVWIPTPGDVLDVCDHRITSSGEAAPMTSHPFETYIRPLRAALEPGPVSNEDGLLDYFRWTGYRGDLVLQIVETDENFISVIRDTWLDLSGPRILTGRPPAAHRCLRMKVRAEVFRHVLLLGLPWEEITIGFNARLTRDPDHYNMDFWEHMQNRLPVDPPFPDAAYLRSRKSTQSQHPGGRR